MRNKIITLFLLTLPLTTFSESRIKVAVIDTGVHVFMANEDFMCDEKPVSYSGNSPYDTHGHGTNIIGIISEGINPKTHCIVSINFYKQEASGEQSLKAIVKSLKHVYNDHSIRYLNLSLGGPTPSNVEKLYIKRLLLRGVTIVAAAGNDGQNLDIPRNNYYPASYKETLNYSNFYVVKSLSHTSNYGKIVTDTFSGINVKPKFWYSKRMTGTSQATAQKMSSILKNVVLYKTGDVDEQHKSDRRRKCN